MASEAPRATTRALFARPSSQLRPYIVIPFLLVAAALGVLSWHSYQLSARTERALSALSVQYLHHAAEISASRADAVVRAEIFQAAEEWQLVERESSVTRASLDQWLRRNPWIVFALYLPDEDPTGAIFVSQDIDNEQPTRTFRNEFFTGSGSIRYSYDPSRLLQIVRRAIEQESQVHMAHLPEAMEVRRRTQIGVVPRGAQIGFIDTSLGPSVVVPLAPPLHDYAIRAYIDSFFDDSWWQNARTVSLGYAILALIVVAVGAAFAIRGLQREADALRLRSALIANVSHELRTPLSMIRMGAETLKRGARLPEKDRSDIQDSMLREVLHLSHLVENVLDVARLSKSAQPLVFNPVDPVDLVESVVSLYESWIRSKGFELEVEIDAGPDEQMWDREAVSRALLNLIDNGVKYSADRKRLRIRLFEDDEFVAIEVQDSGIGIPHEDLEHIFEPYYRAQFSDTQTRRGAGLGLTLVQQIVHSHGGRIEVDSTPGQGSAFRLLFPKKSAGAEARRNLRAREA